MVLCRAAVREGPRSHGVSRRAGRPAHAHHRGQGGLLPRSGGAGLSCEYQQQLAKTRRDWPARLADRGLPARQRRHRQSPDARRRVLDAASPARPPRPRSTGRASPSTRTRSRSTEPPDGRQRHPHRHAGGHDARPARTGNGSHRRASSPVCCRPGRRRRRAQGRRRRRTICAGASRSIRSRHDHVTTARAARWPIASPTRWLMTDRWLARSRDSRPPRSGRLRRVAATFEAGGPLIAEAGTGTGNTLAYSCCRPCSAASAC